MATKYVPKGPVSRAIHEFEETFIALLLGLMTLVTFANVVLRYAFNSQLIWGLELVLILFAWLVLFGISYGFKVTMHLGVDAILAIVNPRVRFVMSLIAALITLAYMLLLLKGAWDYWAPFAGFDATSGRWFPTGFENTRDQGWYETEQIPIPFLQGWLENTFNVGEPYEKMPRLVPYFILPFGAFLMVVRVIEATLRLIKAGDGSLIVSHEAEDAVEEVAALNKEN
ncbi:MULTISPECIES: TRAP transporter small permease [unclassified Marivivens]|jgi:C4-dicarboxylate transporter DctQ subunit|uniref:TRAP transporter small permease n=1 Tax=unclassified Marivivens TaxID=2622455 RepID=UPI00080033D5|nr:MULTISPECIES: TRAP transporter small permease [unclassified Marivivens]APO86561.1 TRAP transporter small permease protein [Marivivens sp. JLT3646]NVJ94450.1 TRAP transporter small permease [Marivivens sp.]OBR37653.1 C4-dicarboxylate ABC transporter substrate-binding protein [Donghicola sp. JL3646]